MFKRLIFPLCLMFTAVWLEADEYTVAVVPKSTSTEFWKSVHKGAIKAVDELATTGSEVNLIWRGPSKENDSEGQARLVESLVARHVSGIVIAPIDSDAIIAPVDAAADAEVPVVAINSPIGSKSVISFVGAQDSEEGLRAAEVLGELLQSKGKVLIFHSETSTAISACEAGFQEGLRTTYPSIKIITDDPSAAATPEAVDEAVKAPVAPVNQAAQTLLSRFGKEVQGIFTSSEESTTAMIRALKDAGLNGKVKLVGTGVSQPAMEAMRTGDLQALVTQDPSQLGYLGVKTLVQHLGGDQADSRVKVPIRVITPLDMGGEDLPPQEAGAVE